MNRRLAAILAADIAGYSRLMHEDETSTVRDLKAHQDVVLPLIARYGGRIIDTAGDGILAEFPSVVGATGCAIEIQTVMAARNQTVPEHRRMRFRIGINLGDVVHDETRIYGDGINIAARLEALADPGGVLVRSRLGVRLARPDRRGRGGGGGDPQAETGLDRPADVRRSVGELGQCDVPQGTSGSSTAYARRDCPSDEPPGRRGARSPIRGGTKSPLDSGSVI
jgi:class 3 adenylate cyclase